MKRRTNKNTTPTQDESASSATLNMKLERPIHDRFCKVAKASRRTKTSIVLEALEEFLPKLEKRYEDMEAA